MQFTWSTLSSSSELFELELCDPCEMLFAFVPCELEPLGNKG